MPGSATIASSQRTRILVRWYLHELRMAGGALEPSAVTGDVFQDLAVADLRRRCKDAEDVGEALRQRLLQAQHEAVHLAIAIREVRPRCEAKNDPAVNDAALRLMRALGVEDL